MPEMLEDAVRSLDPTQATELSLLVELEARWQNMLGTAWRAQEVGSSTQSLQAIQRAHSAFHSKLMAYNKLYTLAYVPGLLLNTLSRLAGWCRSMRQLYLLVEHEPRAQCPAHLLEKAYRCAERVSVRLNKEGVSRPTPPATIRAAIQELEALGRWCDDLVARVAPPATPEVTTAPLASPNPLCDPEESRSGRPGPSPERCGGAAGGIAGPP
jgi:hypothetical protein